MGRDGQFKRRHSWVVTHDCVTYSSIDILLNNQSLYKGSQRLTLSFTYMYNLG